MTNTASGTLFMLLMPVRFFSSSSLAAGRVWFRSAWQIGLVVNEFGPGLLVGMRRPRTDKSPFGGGMFVLTLYGFDQSAHEALTQRWRTWFERQLRQRHRADVSRGSVRQWEDARDVFRFVDRVAPGHGVVLRLPIAHERQHAIEFPHLRVGLDGRGLRNDSQEGRSLAPSAMVRHP